PAVACRLGSRLPHEQHEGHVCSDSRGLRAGGTQGDDAAAQAARSRRGAVGAPAAQPRRPSGDSQERSSPRLDDGDHRPRGLSPRLDRQPWQLVVICGRNEKLRRRLYELEASTPMLILGFVDYLPELMRACDLVVTKAGPGAIAEALATGLPLVITGFLPGQESPNVDFVVESGIGSFAPKESDLRDEVRVLAEGG